MSSRVSLVCMLVCVVCAFGYVVTKYVLHAGPASLFLGATVLMGLLIAADSAIKTVR